MSDGRRFVIVTGPGRSGTSLCMAVLQALGLRLSPDLLPGAAQNPRGLMEDRRIVEIDKALIDLVFRGGVLPRPGRWSGDPEVAARVAELEAEIEARTAEPGCWAVKDPRIANLARLWIAASNRLRLSPVHILCLRAPEICVASMIRQYDMSPLQADYLWLMRVLHFLDATGGRVFLLRYEDWHDRPAALATALATWVGAAPDPAAIASSRAVFEPRLDHAGGDAAAAPHSRGLWRRLEGFRDADFDPAALQAAIAPVKAQTAQHGDILSLAYDLMHGGAARQPDPRLSALEARLTRLEARASPASNPRSGG